MDSLSWILEKSDRWVAVVILGVFGGFVRAVADKDISWRKFLSGILSSAFASVLMALAVADLQISFSFKGLLIGLSGYCATVTLDYLSLFFMRRLEKIAADKNEKKGVRK